ncbi:prenyltransferase [Marinobacterium jannaschii]|uniref:prenyltransferase n=1 Tax=Marinobacterium jannaschii TaxID=64970 RepID=UPI0014712B3B|nr:prenyltransferase [Marinobacterium jannaschii]
MSVAVMETDKYCLRRALRPFSFSVALITCLTGILTAAADGFGDPLRILAVLCGGVLLQAGVNLINDYSDLDALRQPDAVQQVQRNFRLGLGCFAVATLIALWLITQVGSSLLLLCSVGLVGALGYTLKPINYKARGLGVVLVFWLMGVLMVTGSHLAISGEWSLKAAVLSLPLSVLVALLLLSNELRDIESDRADGIETLTVRVGYQHAARYYRIALLAVCILTAVLLIAGYLASIWLLLPSILLLPGLLRLLRSSPQVRRALTPRTGRLLLVYGVGYCLTLATALL